MKQKKYISVIILLNITLIFMIYSLAGFYQNIQQKEYEMQQKMLQNFSAHNSATIENKLTGYLNMLSGVEKFLIDKKLDSNDTRQLLKKIVEQDNVDFQRIGLAGTDGNSWVTNNKEINISDRDFFVAAMNNKTMVTGSKDSKIVDASVFIVSVPVLDKDSHVRGVLYGVVETESFQIYDNIETEGIDSLNIYVIDCNGSYIMKKTKDESINLDDNFFEWLYKVETDIPVREIIEQIRCGKNVFTEIDSGDDAYVAYFSSDKMDTWYTVTIMNKKTITEPIQRLMKNDVSGLIMKIIGSVVLLCVIILYYSEKEKEKVLELNRQLKFKDEIFQIVTEKSSIIIGVYDLKTKRLHFINQSDIKTRLPSEIENAPERLLNYLPDSGETKKQVQNIFANMEHLDKNERFDISVDDDGVTQNYQVRITTLLNEKKEVVQCVGIIDNVTETFQLSKKANVDYLTGLYNRRKGTEMIDHLLKNANGYKNHAFVIFDLDNFKLLNDTLGHQMGDQALKDVAEILKKHFRNYDIICRLAGDEFVVFLKNIPSSVIPCNMKSLLKKLELVYSNGVKEIAISASAGVSLSPIHGTTFDELYEKADKVLYSVKHSGKNSFAIYEEITESKELNE